MKNLFFKFHATQTKAESGFTLIELIMTIVVLSIAILAMMNLSSTISVKSSQVSVLAQAVLYAEEKIEEVRADRRNPGRGFSWITTSGNYTTENLQGGFTRYVVVDQNSHNGIPYVFIKVVVQHSESSGYSLATWLTDY